jgi:hypothetical protein
MPKPFIHNHLYNWELSLYEHKQLKFNGDAKMSKNTTVYILGAGFNQCVNGEFGMKPPLSTNFFNVILKNKKYDNTDYYKKTECVYEYILKYWKKSKQQLCYEQFNLEDCFTLIQLQLLETKANGDYKTFSKLLDINSALKFMFIESLSDFLSFSSSSDLMLSFSKLIYSREANVITLNYDCNLENAIKTSSNNCFDLSLCYGSNFDNFPNMALYKWNILKLHGSLNWFKYVYDNNKTKIVLHSDENVEDYKRGTILFEPLIIPPVLYKDYSQEFISNLWKKAKTILSCCKTLIVIGYSLPATDFGIKKLLLESFTVNKLEKLIIVNPNTTVINTIKELTHFDKPVVVCDNLSEFLANLEDF